MKILQVDTGVLLILNTDLRFFLRDAKFFQLDELVRLLERPRAYRLHSLINDTL